jgi:HlyD family secretion protein
MVFKELKPRRGWIVVMAAGAIALGLIGLGVTQLRQNQTQSTQRQSQTPAPLPQKVTVVALGRLEPQGEAIRVSGPNGERIGKLLVSRGDFVKVGAVIAYLESYDERLAERNYAASQLAEARERLKATTAYSKAQIQEAQTRIQQVDRPGTFEVEAQRATVRQLKAELALAQTDLQRNQNLYQEGAIAKQELDRQVSQTRSLQEQLNNAKASLVWLENAVKTNLSNAQAQLKSQQTNLPLSQVQVAARSAAQNLNLAEARLQRTIIRAPRTGRILRVFAYPGEAIGDDGIVEMGDTRRMYAVAEVYESDVGLVKVGQKATITSRNGAFSKQLTGKVSEVGWQIFKNNVLDDDPAANADARVVEVRVLLDDSQAVAALTNLQVDVKINVK